MENEWLQRSLVELQTQLAVAQGERQDALAATACSEARAKELSDESASLHEQVVLLEQRLVVLGEHDFVHMVLSLNTATHANTTTEASKRLAARKAFLDDALLAKAVVRVLTVNIGEVRGWNLEQLDDKSKFKK